MNMKQESSKKSKIQSNLFATINKNMKRSHSSELLGTHSAKNSQFKRLSSTQIFTYSQSKSVCPLKKKSKKNLANSDTKTTKKKRKNVKDHGKGKRKNKKTKEAKNKRFEEKQL